VPINKKEIFEGKCDHCKEKFTHDEAVLDFREYGLALCWRCFDVMDTRNFVYFLFSGELHNIAKIFKTDNFSITDECYTSLFTKLVFKEVPENEL
jgi:hypothetical protein